MNDSTPVPGPVADLAARWRDDADVLRAHGAVPAAETCERHAEEMEEAVRAWWTEELSVAEAAAWSGYSRERIRELVRAGKLPDRRPTGARQGHTFAIRRCDLPRHPLADRDPDAMPAPVDDPEDERPADRAARRTR